MKDNYFNTGRKKQKQKTRERILSSTQKLLTEGKDFTLEEVAKEAGISRATIYRYYSKVEILSEEAGLDLNTKSPEAIYESLEHLEAEDVILGIQDYFNQFSLSNEPALRKFLSVVIAASTTTDKRGARRSKTLRFALDQKNIDLSQEEKENLINIATVLMGMEPLIVTKDVSRLNEEQSLQLLNWGLRMILKGLLSQKLV